jgi:undecaprenyl diphosphate synthase
LIAEVQENELDVETIDEQVFGSFMSLNDVTEPDLLIRTGGEQRISNFLIWQLAYSELYFVDTLWPDFSDKDFESALNWFAGRQRRFGKTGQQIQQEQDEAAVTQ